MDKLYFDGIIILTEWISLWQKRMVWWAQMVQTLHCNVTSNDCIYIKSNSINTMRLRQTCRHFADDILKWIFLNENVWILLKLSLKFVPKVRINNIPALDQIMAWRRPGDKPLSEPMMVWLLTHIYVTGPQRVKSYRNGFTNLVAMKLFQWVW